jgi:uncharacterized protein (TIGR03435 family)
MVVRFALRTALVLLLLEAGRSPARAERPAAGQPSPPIAFEEVVHGPANPADLVEELAGNVVVLEFWGTWCVPCVQNIPHHNELVEAFADRPVRFVAITDEKRSIVETFLGERPIDGWVVLDADRSVFSAFGILPLPAAVILAADGTIAGYDDPRSMTGELLNAVIDGRRVAPSAPRTDLPQFPDTGSPAEPPLYQVTVRPVPWKQRVDEQGRRESRVSLGQGDHLVAEGITLHKALELAWQIEPQQLRLAFIPEEEVYDIVVYPGSGPDSAWREHLRTALIGAFGLSVRRERRAENVLVLGLIDDTPPETEASTQSGQLRFGPGEIVLQRGTSSSLCDVLGQVLRQPVVDEAGITIPFDCELHWDPRAPDTLFEAVRDQLGFSLRRERREVEMLVVERRSGQSAHVPDPSAPRDGAARETPEIPTRVD